MSRIDLKGFGGYAPNDDFDDFSFGALPEDEDLDAEQLEDNIDAVNDETFGVDLDDDGLDDDLEQYSKQTANLQLDDSFRWLDEPTCSVSAPDPSELPTPPFMFDSFSSRKESNSVCENLGAFKMQLGTTDSLWKNVDAATSYDRNEPELSTWQKFTSDRMSKKKENDDITENCNFSSLESPIKSDRLPKLAEVPKNAPTLEEIERSHLNSTVKPAVPSVPPLPSEGALTLAELEKKLLTEAVHRTATVSTLNAADDRSLDILPPESRITQLISVPPQPLPPQPQPPPPQPPPPPLPYLPFPMLPPFAVQMIRAHLLGHLPELPPGFPPITPQMRAAILPLGPPPMPRMPSDVMPPPFSFVQQLRHSKAARPPIPSHLMCQPQMQMHSQMPPTMHHSRTHNRDRASRRAGLPSNKTISDFALSPFAGFVSKKEREWLIKIQQLQCQGCGTPYEDDFYYTTWKQRKIALERREKGLKPEDEECDYLVNTGNPHHYVPPKFAGSLGKPTLSTVNYPRHLIDLSNDSTDDDDKLSMKSSTSSKKLRALLLQLENVALLIIECDDRQRALSAPSLSDEVQNELKDGIKSRLKVVIDSLCLNERLQIVLLINKGRQMFTRALSYSDEQQQLYLLNNFFSSLTYAGKRVPANEMNESLLMPIFEALSRFSKNTFIDFMQNLKMDSALDVTLNTFMTNLLLSLLVCCSRKDCRLDSHFCITTLSFLLRSCSEELECNLGQYITLTLADVKLLDAWSACNITGYRGSVVEKLIQNLQLTCKSLKSDTK